ncbi:MULTISPECIES: hypothetical protein [unclassified Gordonia (in: high G+C Gram-positive bacteria)]|uniref:protein kinase domain-containing protein n=1 Tax=unclassified Gordonia (in: high G+C Gram-positive bacteria) TaxID=2657482 RepID=UPI001F0EEFD5|nr:hypothetical protein [Gordonia sp. ABSL49_1]MCH5644531.1 hypothetical protein [Gordonia sp. ABSL49_1]
MTMPLSPGDVFADNRVVSSAGVGEFGENYLVEAERSEPRVLTVVTSAVDVDMQSRVAEALGAWAQLEHPGIVAVRRHGVEDGVPWFVTDRIAGRRLDAEPLSVGEVGAVIEQAAAALDHAHRHGVVHGRLMPANIFVGSDGPASTLRVLLSDFGIGAAVAGSTGSPYAAPETATGPATARADEYSLAAIAYQRLTGTAPTAPHIAPIGALRADAVNLDPVFAAALSDDPDLRYPSCSTFAAALTTGLRGGLPDEFTPVDPVDQSTVRASYPSTVATGPPPGPWPPPPNANRYPGPTPRKGRRGLWWVLGAVAAVIIVAVAATTTVLLLVGGDDAKPDTSVSAGPAACVLSSGKVYCWGKSAQGLADDNPAVTDQPTLVPDLTGVSVISSDYDVDLERGNVCAVSRGELYCWGANGFGQLGSETPTSSATPLMVAGLSGVTAVSTGYDTTCAVADRKAYCWGDNGDGQLGNGSATGEVAMPRQISQLADVTAIDTDDGTTCAIAGGDVYCWGRADEGQVGPGNTSDVVTPTKIDGIGKATAVTTDAGTVCATVSGGDAYCWGDNDSGQLGDGGSTSATTPQKVRDLSKVTAISTGANTTCAVAGGDAYCWGSNSTGQFGQEGPSSVSTPQKLSGVADVTDISTAEGSTCAVDGGGVFCWGANTYGQVGDGSTTNRWTPAQVQLPK